MKFFKKLLSKKLITIFIILALISGGILKFKVFNAKAQTETTIVKKGDLVQESVLSGEIDAKEHVTLQFQTSGKLSYVAVKEGDNVKKFQTVASLDQRQLKKTLEKKLNDYMTERMDFDQTKDDHKNKETDAVKRVIQKAQDDLNNTVLDVELQTITIELASLVTPIDGIVTKAETPYAGVNIYSPNDAQFEIVNPKTIYFSVNADQTEIVNLKEGMTGSITLDSYPEEEINATIKNISFTPKEGETETVYEIEVELSDINNDDYKYRMGMTGDIIFETDRKRDSLYLPSNFIKTDDKGKYVLSGNKKEKKYIKAGMETDTNIEIIEGLNKGDLVYD